MSKRRRGIYLLPNLFTTAALFCGFYAIVAAINARYELAAIAMFVAMVLDGMDGRIARMTNTQSDFGVQYDSLSDLVSFGLAPALVMYQWSLYGLGKPGWLAAFVYAAATALRLARFNTQAETEDKQFFQGLPSPAAAALIAGFIWLGDANDLNDGTNLIWITFPLTVAAGLLMVSNIRYHSFKQFDLKGRVPFADPDCHFSLGVGTIRNGVHRIQLHLAATVNDSFNRLKNGVDGTTTLCFSDFFYALNR